MAKLTRRREFLKQMQAVLPRSELVALLTSYRPEGKRGRTPFAPETMPRIHFVQQWFTLSDPSMEEALHDVPLFREFAGMECWSERLPDESTTRFDSSSASSGTSKFAMATWPRMRPSCTRWLRWPPGGWRAENWPQLGHECARNAPDQPLGLKFADLQRQQGRVKAVQQPAQIKSLARHVATKFVQTFLNPPRKHPHRFSGCTI